MYTSAHILKAIGESYFEIENNASLKKSINTILQKLGQATGVDRVYVFKNHLNEQGEPCMTYPRLQLLGVKKENFGKFSFF